MSQRVNVLTLDDLATSYDPNSYYHIKNRDGGPDECIILYVDFTGQAYSINAQEYAPKYVIAAFPAILDGPPKPERDNMKFVVFDIIRYRSTNCFFRVNGGDGWQQVQPLAPKDALFKGYANMLRYTSLPTPFRLESYNCAIRALCQHAFKHENIPDVAGVDKSKFTCKVIEGDNGRLDLSLVKELLLSTARPRGTYIRENELNKIHVSGEIGGDTEDEDYEQDGVDVAKVDVNKNDIYYHALVKADVIQDNKLKNFFLDPLHERLTDLLRWDLRSVLAREDNNVDMMRRYGVEMTTVSRDLDDQTEAEIQKDYIELFRKTEEDVVQCRICLDQRVDDANKVVKKTPCKGCKRVICELCWNDLYSPLGYQNPFKCDRCSSFITLRVQRRLMEKHIQAAALVKMSKLFNVEGSDEEEQPLTARATGHISEQVRRAKLFLGMKLRRYENAMDVLLSKGGGATEAYATLERKKQRVRKLLNKEQGSFHSIYFADDLGRYCYNVEALSYFHIKAVRLQQSENRFQTKLEWDESEADFDDDVRSVAPSWDPLHAVHNRKRAGERQGRESDGIPNETAEACYYECGQAIGQAKEIIELYVRYVQAEHNLRDQELFVRERFLRFIRALQECEKALLQKIKDERDAFSTLVIPVSEQAVVDIKFLEMEGMSRKIAKHVNYLRGVYWDYYPRPT